MLDIFQSLFIQMGRYEMILGVLKVRRCQTRNVQRMSKKRRGWIMEVGGGVTALTLFYEHDNWGNHRKRNKFTRELRTPVTSLLKRCFVREPSALLCAGEYKMRICLSSFQQWPWTRACPPFKTSLHSEATSQCDQIESPWFMWLIWVEQCSWQFPLNCLIWELN